MAWMGREGERDKPSGSKPMASEELDALHRVDTEVLRKFLVWDAEWFIFIHDADSRRKIRIPNKRATHQLHVDRDCWSETLTGAGRQ